MTEPLIAKGGGEVPIGKLKDAAPCPLCGETMKFVEDAWHHRCTNPDCQHTVTAWFPKPTTA